MIQEFVDRFIAKKQVFLDSIKKHPNEYIEIVKLVVKTLDDSAIKREWHEKVGYLDVNKITEVDYEGGYDGSSIYIIGSKGNNGYWYTSVDYGTCSLCDTLLSIRDLSSDDNVTDGQKEDYYTLGLHIVQKMRPMFEDGSV